ncbi:MAG TPA: cation diffusion facilitator family transporter, partial [Lamprocystis sp. (in: g-proteobacteria)]|nr:cation diffusion facilitator family transporter [Lamprocystis sp. (in: g-proteobacteria)]
MTTEEASRIEQQVLRRSIIGVLLVAVGSVVYGLVLESDVVILNGIFSVLSIVAGGLRLLAAKLVVKPADKRFPYGYSHVEPLVQSVNGFLVLVICIYSFINGVEGVREGGHAVDAAGVIWFSVVSAVVCLGFWAYGLVLGRKIGSELVKNDAKEWAMDFAFSMVTLAGFVVLPFLPEPYRTTWAGYADPAMVAVMALLLTPIPLGMLNQSLREVLLMVDINDALIRRVESIMRELNAEHDIERFIHHVVKTGRIYFVEIDIVVGPDFTPQTIAEQDRLRERIWNAMAVSP